MGADYISIPNKTKTFFTPTGKCPSSAIQKRHTHNTLVGGQIAKKRGIKEGSKKKKKKTRKG